jgi:hypothetical protein
LPASRQNRTAHRQDLSKHQKTFFAGCPVATNSGACAATFKMGSAKTEILAQSVSGTRNNSGACAATFKMGSVKTATATQLMSGTRNNSGAGDATFKMGSAKTATAAQLMSGTRNNSGAGDATFKMRRAKTATSTQLMSGTRNNSGACDATFKMGRAKTETATQLMSGTRNNSGACAATGETRKTFFHPEKPLSEVRRHIYYIISSLPASRQNRTDHRQSELFFRRRYTVPFTSVAIDIEAVNGYFPSRDQVVTQKTASKIISL